MKTKRENIEWLFPILSLFVSIIVAIIVNIHSGKSVSSDEVYVMVERMTTGYQIKQIASVSLLFLFGFIVSFVLWGDESIVKVVSWSLPIAVVLWCTSSLGLLLLSIPYNIYTALLSLVLISTALCFSNFDKLKKIKSFRNIRALLCVLSLIVLISSGIRAFPIFLSADSYYCVMQYGEVIAKTGSLLYETSGMNMSSTGTSFALLSSFSTLFGYETITVTHWGLILSLLLGISHETYASMLKSHSAKKAHVYAVVVSLLLAFMPPFMILSTWVISNTYCMVLLFFLMTGVYQYSLQSRENDCLILVMALFVVCIGMGRAEMPVCMAALIVSFGTIVSSRRGMLILSVPVAVYESAFLGRLVIQRRSSNEIVDMNFYPRWVILALLFAVWATVLYALLLKTKAEVLLNKYISRVFIIILPILCCLTVLKGKESFLINIGSIWYNLNNAYWGTVPILLAILAIIYALIFRKVSFYLLFSYVYLFMNLLTCLGKDSLLRNGVGDSCNRMLVSALPILYFSFVEGIGTQCNVKIQEEVG